MDKRLGKYANEKKDFVRPKQDIRGNPIREDEPLHRTRGIGGEYFVMLPLMDNDFVTIDQIIADLRDGLANVAKSKVVKASK